MKSVLDKIALEQHRFNNKNVICKINRTYVSGEFDGTLEFNIEFKCLNGANRRIKLYTRADAKDMGIKSSDVIRKMSMLKKDNIVSFNDIKSYILQLFLLQNDNKSSLLNYIYNEKKDGKNSQSYTYSFIFDNKDRIMSLQDEISHITKNMTDLVNLLDNDVNYQNYHKTVYEEEILDTDKIKLDILNYFKISTGSNHIKSRQKDTYLKRLQILSNLVNDNIYHYNNTLEEYLGVEYVDDLKLKLDNMSLDFNLYYLDGNGIPSSFKSLDFKDFIQDVACDKYGRIFKRYFTEIVYRSFYRLNALLDVKYDIVNNNCLDLLISLGDIESSADRSNYIKVYNEVMNAIFLKANSYKLWNEADEMLCTTDNYMDFRLGIYDFEVYYNDFNVSFINTNFRDLINYNISKGKFEKAKESKENLKNCEDSYKFNTDMVLRDRVDIVNDIFKLNHLMSKLNLLVGFNSFYYDNAILYGLIYNLNVCRIDISNIFITKSDIEYLENYLRQEGNGTDFQDIYHSESIIHCFKEGSLLYNLNNSIIDKVYKCKISKNDPRFKAIKNRLYYFKKFLSIILQQKAVNVVVGDLYKIVDNSNVEYENRLLTSDEISNIRFAHQSGYKGILSIDVRDEMGDEFVSLKLIEGYLGMSIEEFEDFTIQYKLSSEQMDESVRYCRHDVYATLMAFLNRLDFFISKFDMLTLFKMPYIDITKTRARIMSKSLSIFEGVQYNDRLDLDYVDHIVRICEDKNDDYKDNVAYDSLKNIKNSFDVKKNKFIKDKVPFEVLEKSKGVTYKIMGVEHEIKFGGLHGAIPNMLYNGRMIMVDVGSYYPSLMIMYEMFTRSTPNKLTFPKLYLNRMYLKRAKDPKEKVYKIALNSTFGILKDPTSVAIDAVQSNNICVNGQLALIELLCRLNGITNVIQSNTDGILITAPGDERLEQKIDDIIRSWEIDYKFKLDKDIYTGIAQRDVNNYFVFNKDNPKKVKAKGEFKKYNKGIDIDAFANTNRYKDQILTSYYLNVLGVDNGFGDGETTDYNKIYKELEKLSRVDISALQTVAKQGAFEYVIQNVNMNESDLIDHIKTTYNITLSSDEFKDLDYLVSKYPNVFDEIRVNLENLNYDCKLKVQRVNRFFATTDTRFGKIEKVKTTDNGGKTYSKVPDSSDNVRIYNKQLLGDNINLDDILNTLSLDLHYYTVLLLDKIEKFDMTFPSKSAMIMQYNSNNWYEVVEDHISTPTEKKVLSSCISNAKDSIKKINDISSEKLLKHIKKIVKGMTLSKYNSKNDELFEELNVIISNLKESLIKTDVPYNVIKYSLSEISKIGLDIVGRMHNLANPSSFILRPEISLFITEISNYLSFLNKFGIQDMGGHYYISLFHLCAEYIRTKSTNFESAINDHKYIEDFNKTTEIRLDLGKSILDVEQLDYIQNRLLELNNMIKVSIEDNSMKSNKDTFKQIKAKIINNIDDILQFSKSKYKSVIESDIKDFKDSIYEFEKLFERRDVSKYVSSYKKLHILNVALRDGIVDKLYLNSIITSVNRDLSLVDLDVF